MGTRADFYIGRGLNAEWIGSTAWDGYPEGIDITTTKVDRVAPGVDLQEHDKFLPGFHLFDAASETEFRERVGMYFANRRDVTLHSMGWPWPWDDSQTTDYAYAFDDGKVWASRFGSTWFDPNLPEPEDLDRKVAIFPNMKSVQRVTLGKRSGVIVLVTRGIEESE